LHALNSERFNLGKFGIYVLFKTNSNKSSKAKHDKFKYFQKEISKGFAAFMQSHVEHRQEACEEAAGNETFEECCTQKTCVCQSPAS
jgi:hypothetical protein